MRTLRYLIVIAKCAFSVGVRIKNLTALYDDVIIRAVTKM